MGQEQWNLWVMRRNLLGERVETNYQTIFNGEPTEREHIVINDLHDMLDVFDEMLAEIDRLNSRWISNRPLTDAEVAHGLELEQVAAKHLDTQPGAEG